MFYRNDLASSHIGFTLFNVKFFNALAPVSWVKLFAPILYPNQDDTTTKAFYVPLSHTVHSNAVPVPCSPSSSDQYHVFAYKAVCDHVVASAGYNRNSHLFLRVILLPS